MLVVRAWSAVVFVSLALVVSEVVQRLVVAPWVWLRPSKRVPVLAGWQRIMAWAVTRPVAFLSGCTIPRPHRVVPTAPGVLVLMNHQSLFDIPLVIQTVVDGYPRIVTRKRYGSRIPLISHMTRLYQYPLVDPAANRSELRESIESLARAAAETDVPLVVFPEGTRTKDGEIHRFKKGALSQILAARAWTVYVFVVDGFWRAGKFKDFFRQVAHIEGKFEHVATLEWTDPTADATEFIREVRNMMKERLSAMRGEVPAG